MIVIFQGPYTLNGDEGTTYEDITNLAFDKFKVYACTNPSDGCTVWEFIPGPAGDYTFAPSVQNPVYSSTPINLTTLFQSGIISSDYPSGTPFKISFISATNDVEIDWYNLEMDASGYTSVGPGVSFDVPSGYPMFKDLQYEGPIGVGTSYNFSPGCTNPTQCNYDENATIDDNSCTYPEVGDINQDCTFDVLDVVETVEVVLQETQQTEEQILLSDINNDGVVDVIDIVMLVGIVLGRLMMRF